MLVFIGHVCQRSPQLDNTVAAVPVVWLRNMDSVFAESIRRPRLLAQLLGAFAGLALPSSRDISPFRLSRAPQNRRRFAEAGH